MSEEDQKQFTIETELAEYISEPLHPSSTDATFRDILSYWKVSLSHRPHFFLA
jgi:hypothetical protein